MVDLHCDESDDPLSRHVETLAYEAKRLGLGARRDRLALNLDAFEDQYTGRSCSLIAESDQRHRQSAITSPCRVRHDTYPRRRGPDRIPRCAAGVAVALGQDCVMDRGTARRADIARRPIWGSRRAMTSREAIR